MRAGSEDEPDRVLIRNQVLVPDAVAEHPPFVPAAAFPQPDLAPQT